MDSTNIIDISNRSMPAARPAGQVSDAERQIGEILSSKDMRDRMLRVAKKYAPPGEAEDAVHDAVLQALTRAKSFRGDALATTWMHTIVVNAALMRRRKTTRLARRQGDVEVDEAPVVAPVPDAPEASPVVALERSEDVRRVRAAVSTLPVSYREVVERCMLAEQAPDEVAPALGVSTSCLRTRVLRARRRLAEALAA